MKAPVSSIVVRDRVRKEIGDLSSLMQSMRDHGQLNPISITRDNELIAGHRRLLAARQLSWQYIEVHIVERDSDIERLELELEENVHRKDFSPEELLDGFRRLDKLRQPPLRTRIGRFFRDFFRKLFRFRRREEPAPPDSATPDDEASSLGQAKPEPEPERRNYSGDQDSYGI